MSSLLIIFLTITLIVLHPRTAQSTSIESGYALIVNTWNDFLQPNASNAAAMPGQSLQAYYVLKKLGYDDSHIVLLLHHDNQTMIDFDGDGENDLSSAQVDVEDDAINKSRLIEELESLKLLVNQANVSLLIYVIGHGEILANGTSILTFENGDYVSETEFSSWLNDVTCRQIVVLLDFCYSGRFFQRLVGQQNLVIVSSSDEHHMSWFYWDWSLVDSERAVFGRSGSSFFHPFWTRIEKNETVEEAYLYAKTMCSHWGDVDHTSKSVVDFQNPRIWPVAQEAELPKELSVRLDKSYTKFLASTYANEPAQLQVKVESTASHETELMLKVSGDNLKINPSGEQIFIAQGGTNTYLYFSVASNTTGLFPVQVELWHGSSQIDFTSCNLHVKEPFVLRDFTSYEVRLSMVYLVAVFTILIIYLRYFIGDDEDFRNWALFLGFFYWFAGILLLIGGYLPDFLMLIISQSVGRMETILVMSFIFCLSAIILTIQGKRSYGLLLSNIVLIMISLLVFLDWLVSPLLPMPVDIGGKLLWEVIATILSVVFGIFLDRILKGHLPSFSRQ